MPIRINFWWEVLRIHPAAYQSIQKSVLTPTSSCLFLSETAVGGWEFAFLQLDHSCVHELYQTIWQSLSIRTRQNKLPTNPTQRDRGNREKPRDTSVYRDKLINSTNLLKRQVETSGDVASRIREALLTLTQGFIAHSPASLSTTHTTSQLPTRNFE